MRDDLEGELDEDEVKKILNVTNQYIKDPITDVNWIF